MIYIKFILQHSLHVMRRIHLLWVDLIHYCSNVVSGFKKYKKI